ncbi:MAG: ACP phosphodiesterase [Granulosicoccus sp.]
MNFLAHSLLGFNDSELVAGQFCGDFVRGSDLSHFPEGVERGIRLHRHLDRFTDTHAALAPARAQIPDVPRRLAGIVVDVMFDHYLARRWDQVSEVTLDHHAKSVIVALNRHEEHFPLPLKRFTRLLQREDILQNNIHLSSIELTLSRIAGRSTKFGALALTTEQLEPLRDTLIRPFDTFFPDLHKTAIDYISQHSKIRSSETRTHQ